jgi:septal ring factor EnvC (AmiA/AmiB activator)
MIAMLRNHLLLPLLLAGLVGILWGCAPAPQQSPVADKSVDARVTKLERELKTVQESSAALSAQIKQEQARVLEVEKEREDLRAQLKAKHAEREMVQSQYDGFRKGVRDLLTQADAAAAPKPPTESPAGQPVAQK